MHSLQAWVWASSTQGEGRELKQRGRGKGVDVLLGYLFIHLAVPTVHRNRGPARTMVVKLSVKEP